MPLYSQPILVTGGAGFIGSNLADRLAASGHRVRVLDNLLRPGVEDNLEWLARRHGDLIEPEIADIRDADRVSRAAKGVGAVYHFAAQVAVTTSMDDPRADLDTNIGGTFNVLEAVRRQSSAIPVIFASTNKVYGALSDIGLQQAVDGYTPTDVDYARHGVSVARPLDFHTPYGCSKGAADQYVLDYARSFGMRTAVLRMSCIYGEGQKGTEDQGWVAHFLIRALRGETITLYGDGEQVRDICDISDTCDAYLSMLRRIDRIAGQAFNWGGGPENAVSLLTVIEEIGRAIGTVPKVSFADWRPGDQRWFVADTRSTDMALGLAPRKPWRKGLHDLAAWLSQEQEVSLPMMQSGAVRAAAL